jgi:hypothetical protein
MHYIISRQRNSCGLKYLFVDDYSISPIINGLSDHDAQSITLNKLNINLYAKQFKIIREIKKQTIGDFLIKLSYET